MKDPPESEKENRTTQQLIVRSLEGDLSAFRLLMESQQRYAYAVALPLLRNEENAREVVQEAFVRVWNNLARYRREVKFTTWLYKIVVNLCYDKMKMESRRKNIFGSIGALFDGGDVAGSQDVHRQLEQADLRDHILSEAKKLPPKEQLVFHLRDVQDFSLQEIAEIAGLSIASVKTNLCYARRRLRMALILMQERESS
jgi:RNA polymerase sigma-70 factor (ECF subfamily)